MDERTEATVRRHLRAGFWGLAVYLTLGMVLEAMHAFKVGAYLDVGNETRRLLFRLAHAHGTLIALVQIAFAFAARVEPRAASPVASNAILAALVVLPLGFLLGGLGAHDGDPGILGALAPAGALLLFVGVVAAARRF